MFMFFLVCNTFMDTLLAFHVYFQCVAVFWVMSFPLNTHRRIHTKGLQQTGMHHIYNHKCLLNQKPLSKTFRLYYQKHMVLPVVHMLILYSYCIIPSHLNVYSGSYQRMTSKRALCERFIITVYAIFYDIILTHTICTERLKQT